MKGREGRGGGRNKGIRRERGLPSVLTVPSLPLHHWKVILSPIETRHI